MSEQDHSKWQRLYESGEYPARTQPSPLLIRWLPVLPRGRALDVACGVGRHALELARAGFEVDAVDISSAALARAREAAAAAGLAVHWREMDLDDFRPAPRRYALIVVARYVNRRLMPRLPAALIDGGWLFFEHHLRTRLAVNGPRDPDFRLAPNELLRAFRGLRTVYYREHLVSDPDGMRMALAQLIACNGEGGL